MAKQWQIVNPMSTKDPHANSRDTRAACNFASSWVSNSFRSFARVAPSILPRKGTSRFHWPMGKGCQSWPLPNYHEQCKPQDWAEPVKRIKNKNQVTTNHQMPTKRKKPPNAPTHQGQQPNRTPTHLDGSSMGQSIERKRV